MKGPLSLDLRRRLIQVWKRQRPSQKELAARFLIGEATVGRLLRRYRETGDVLPAPHGGGARARLDERGERYLRSLVERNPDWTTYEFTDAYNKWATVPVHRSTVLRALRRLGFTRKKSPWSPKNVRPSESSAGARTSSRKSPASPLRVWFLWTRPAPTPR
jgi:transposase